MRIKGILAQISLTTFFKKKIARDLLTKIAKEGQITCPLI